MTSNQVLGDIAEIFMGQSPKGDYVNTDGSGYPLLNGPTEFTSRYPKPVQFTTEGRMFSETGDILFCVRGSTTGRMNYADRSYAIGRGIAAIRGKNGYPTPYIRAVIERNLDRLLAAATGSTFPNVGRELILNFEVETVFPNDSLAINDLIVSFEEKIELNRQTNQTLEQIAQAIFKSWFVDFEPTRAKIIIKQKGGDQQAQDLAAQAIICGAVTLEDLATFQLDSPPINAHLLGRIQAKLDVHGGTNAAGAGSTGATNAQTSDELSDNWHPETLATTAALFPSALVDSELGEIPEGWDIGDLNELTNLNQQSWTKKSVPSEVWYVDLTNTKNGVIESLQYYTWEEAPSRAKRILNYGDTIIGTVRPGNRSFAFVGNMVKQLTASTGFAVLSPKKTEYTEFIYLVTTGDENIERLAHLADGGAYPAVKPEVVLATEIVIAHDELFRMFSDLVRPMFNRVQDNLNSNTLLAELRNTLLPKLLSGELQVNEIEV